MITLKYISSFWRTIEMFSINCEVSRHLNCSKNCAIVATNAATIFSIIVTKLYILVVTLSTEDNAKLLEQLKSALKEQSAGINIKQKYQQQK